jgi:hypothetical protein
MCSLCQSSQNYISEAAEFTLGLDVFKPMVNSAAPEL